MKTTGQLKNELVDIDYRINFLENKVKLMRQNCKRVEDLEEIAKDLKEIAQLYNKKEGILRQVSLEKETELEELGGISHEQSRR